MQYTYFKQYPSKMYGTPKKTIFPFDIIEEITILVNERIQDQKECFFQWLSVVAVWISFIYVKEHNS